MRFCIHITSCFVLAVFISMPSFAYAYGLNNIQGEVVVNRGITVSNALLDQVVYSVGDSATLTFTIENKTDTVQPGLTYRVDLVGNFDATTKEPTTRFTTGTSIVMPLLTPGEVYEVEIPYVLPEYVASSDLGFRISVFNDVFELLDTASVPVLITGTKQTSLTYVTQLQVGGRPFPLLAGPTIQVGEQAAFAISFKNTRGTQTLTPFVEVYQGLATAGTSTQNFVGETIPVASSKTTEQRLLLPTFSYTPGVYTAVINYKNADGAVQAGPFEMRYVVAGVRPTLISALPTMFEVEAEQSFDVVVTYQNPPRDILLEATYDPAAYTGKLEAEVNVVDANNLLIGTQRVSFLPGKQDVRLSFVSPRTIYGMRIVTNMFEDDKLLDTRDQFFPDEGALTVEDIRETEPKQRLIVAGSAIVLLLVALGIVAGVRVRVKKQSL